MLVCTNFNHILLLFLFLNYLLLHLLLNHFHILITVSALLTVGVCKHVEETSYTHELMCTHHRTLDRNLSAVVGRLIVNTHLNNHVTIYHPILQIIMILFFYPPIFIYVHCHSSSTTSPCTAHDLMLTNMCCDG